jgi:2-aminoethylphosphonate transport system substrate-binding protein
MRTIFAAALALAAFAAPASAQSGVVTVYSADGLHDGKGSWYETQFDAFTKATGVKVQYIEGGSGGIVERVAKEKSNPQADVLKACYRVLSRKLLPRSTGQAINSYLSSTTI